MIKQETDLFAAPSLLSWLTDTKSNQPKEQTPLPTTRLVSDRANSEISHVAGSEEHETRNGQVGGSHVRYLIRGFLSLYALEFPVSIFLTSLIWRTLLRIILLRMDPMLPLVAFNHEISQPLESSACQLQSSHNYRKRQNQQLCKVDSDRVDLSCGLSADVYML